MMELSEVIKEVDECIRDGKIIDHFVGRCALNYLQILHQVRNGERDDQNNNMKLKTNNRRK